MRRMWTHLTSWPLSADCYNWLLSRLSSYRIQRNKWVITNRIRFTQTVALAMEPVTYQSSVHFWAYWCVNRHGGRRVWHVFRMFALTDSLKFAYEIQCLGYSQSPVSRTSDVSRRITNSRFLLTSCVTRWFKSDLTFLLGPKEFRLVGKLVSRWN